MKDGKLCNYLLSSRFEWKLSTSELHFHANYYYCTYVVQIRILFLVLGPMVSII